MHQPSRATLSSLCLVTLLSASAFGQVTESLLVEARAAIGAWDEAGTRIEGQGEAYVSGTEGSLSLAFAADGSFQYEFDSELPSRAGFDGNQTWVRDRTGLERLIQLEEADRLKLFHWVLCGHWLNTPEVAVNELEGEGGLRLHLDLVGTPMEMTLTLDPASHLPTTLVEDTDSGPWVWSFTDYAEVDGLRLPQRWTFDGGAGEESYHVETYRTLPYDPAPFRPTLEPVRDVFFESEIPPELEVSRMPSGHLLVEPVIEGEFLGAFVFDTGAGITVIDRTVADEMMLETLGHTLAVGVAGSTTSSFRRGEHFQLGPVVIEDPIYGDLDLSFLQPAFGRRVVGIVGYDLLARCVVELEPATARIALHDPARYELAGGTWQDLVLHEGNACAFARFEGDHEALFRLDTGATGNVTFHTSAVTALGLLTGREVSAGSSGGVGGSASAPTGVLDWFELAGHRFEAPRVSFSQATSGAFTDRYTAGNIGQGFMNPFRIILDYRNDRVAFVPLSADR